MNEDERGITPADVTAISIQLTDNLWWVIIEQGNGDVIKEIKLTELEPLQLSAMLGPLPGAVVLDSVEFVDVTRSLEPPTCGN